MTDKKQKSESDKVQACAGCGASGDHPWIAVVNDEPGDSSKFYDVPVCEACHQNPQHRTTPIKGHFFPRQQRRQAVFAAQQQILQD